MRLLGLVALALAFACGGGGGPFGDFPENPGYLRATDETFGKLVIFDADTFEIYRTIDLPKASRSDSHRLQRDDKGRIWIGFSQRYIRQFMGLLPWVVTEAVLVFSPDGELMHEVEVNDYTTCGSPDAGIAFANGYAFIGCVSPGNGEKVIVMDTEAMVVVKTLDVEYSRPANRPHDYFAVRAVEEVSGSVLLLGSGLAPRGYDPLTPQQGGVAKVVRIDTDTLTVSHKAELDPGSRVLDVVEVDGMAWVLNSFSNVRERPPRTDVYVMDPDTLEVVDNFNLPKPYPVWGRMGTDGYVYIYHRADSSSGDGGGVSRIDPVTREVLYTKINDPERGFSTPGFDVYKGQSCMVSGGLRCMNADGTLDLKVEQESSIGVLFAPSAKE